jgi:hypothetical protein
MPDGGLFGGIAEGYMRGQQADLQQRQQKASALADLLHDPTVTQDAKAQIMPLYAETLGIDKKHHGLIGTLGQLFHPGQSQDPKVDWSKAYGNLDEQVQGPSTVGETLDSRVARLKAGVSEDADTSQGLAPTAAPAPVSGVLQQFMRRGDMTGNDIALASHMRTMGAQAQYENQKQREMEIRIKARGDENQKLQTMKSDAAMARVKQIGEQKGDLLDQKALIAAHADYNKYLAIYKDPDVAEQMVQQDFQNKRDLQTSRAALNRAETLALPERIRQAQARIDESSVRTELSRVSIGNAAQGKRYEEYIKQPLADLQSANRQIEYYSKFDLNNPQTPASIAQRLQEAKDLKAGAQNELWKAKGMFNPETPQTTVPQRSSAPSRSSSRRSGNYVPPKVTGPQLNKVLGLP